MPVPVTVPQVTISMEEGKIVHWFKVEGDLVAEGELLFEMETDKATKGGLFRVSAFALAVPFMHYALRGGYLR